jgi:hypothetical protein
MKTGNNTVLKIYIYIYIYDIFDVGMGFFDGAEICELMGLSLLEELKVLDINIDIYRDDGLCVCDLSPRRVECTQFTPNLCSTNLTNIHKCLEKILFTHQTE